MQLDQANTLLEPGYLSLESGTTRLEDGQLHVASRTTMPGCEMRSRFWLGDTDPAAMAAIREARVNLFPDRASDGLHRHCNEEMGYLAEFLPRLYERETR